MSAHNIQWVIDSLTCGLGVLRASAPDRHIHLKRLSDGTPYFYVVEGGNMGPWFPSGTDLLATDYQKVLEKPRDYRQELLDLGCEPEDLGTVTYNPLTRKVDVSRSVYLYRQGLTRLPFAFGKVGGSLGCSYNRLTSLEGAPTKVGRSFECSYNRLVSLEGAPTKVGGDFYCSADDLQDVSALKQCKIGDAIYLLGPKADQERVKKMLRDQGYKGEIR
jgi:hypothetical protein